MTDVDGRMMAWLNGCYDRAEQRAKAATPGPWHEPGPDSVGEWNIYGDGWVIASTRHYPREEMQNYWPKLRKPATVVEHGNENAAHIADHDPQWRLADLARKRKILAIHRTEPGDDKRHWRMPVRACVGCGWDQYEEAAVEDINGCPVVRLLAEEFAGEPGYDESWRP